ncbi:MAG: hypothetical protein DVB32_04740 [Verrucomicrobia bacterium]|jgi:uncharacterized integral membrane protein|nr:MAG: hypothetical protein DVB32_04740 [Verrucomicrobiota bacterium]MCX6881149.1 hypothetical protein [Verrucomicrobiota bacterium]
MNAKLIFKTLFLIVVLLLLVMMGMNNRGTVAFSLPPLLTKSVTQPAALMYIGFFAIGLLSGVILASGTGGKKSAASKSSSSPK